MDSLRGDDYARKYDGLDAQIDQESSHQSICGIQTCFGEIGEQSRHVVEPVICAKRGGNERERELEQQYLHVDVIKLSNVSNPRQPL